MKKIIIYILELILLVSFVYSANEVYDNDSDLISFWKVDDSGSVFTDSKTIGTQYSLEYNGALQQQAALIDYSSYSVGFDGSDDFLNNSVDLDAPLSSMVNFTLGLWVIDMSDDETLMYYGYQLGSNIGFWFEYNDNLLRFQAFDGSPGTDCTWLSPKHSGMLTVRFNTSSDDLDIFMNGSIVKTCTPVADINWGSSACFLIGKRDFDCDGSGDNFATTRFDEVFIINRTLTEAEINSIYNDGILTLSASTTVPIIVNPSPVDNSHNNTNVTLNVSHTSVNNDVRYYLYLSDSSPPLGSDAYLFNVTRSGDKHRSFDTNLSGGTYYWKWQIQNITSGLFSDNTTVRTLIIDTTNPTINILENTSFETDNLTIVSPLVQNLSINISFFDTYLYQTLINVTNETDESVYSILNTSITGTTANYSRVIDISSWALGNYTIKLIATDSHTTTEIPKYDLTYGWDYFRYTTTEGNVIEIESDSFPLTKFTTKLKDRYSFEFNYLTSKDTYKYIIKSYNKIDYLPSSNYPAHFVIMSSNGRGNWLDFGGISKKDISVTKLDDYTYEVEIISNGKKSFTFNSLGGLNTVEENYKLRLGAVIDIWSFDDDTGAPLNATATIGSQFAHTKANTSAATLVNVTKEDTVSLNSSGYGTETKIISVTEKYHNFSLNLTVISAVKAYFYDEMSEELIEGETFSVYVEKSDYSNTFTAATNPYTLVGLTNGLYELKASSTNYPSREYFDVNVSNESTTNINIYLINSTDSETKTFLVRGSAINALDNVNIDFYRLIGGNSKLVAQEITDFDGAATINLDENYKYIINFTKSGFNTQTIELEPVEDEYVITMIRGIDEYNASVYEELRYSFSPSDLILNNNTNYNFSFSLNSSNFDLENCTMKLKNGTDILSESSVYTSPSCFLEIEQNTRTMTNITSEVTYWIEGNDYIVSQQYAVIDTYEGDFSLKNFLDDLTNFGEAGFDGFGRMILAFIVIFAIVFLAARELSITNHELLLAIVWALVGLFSYINWFYLDYAPMPDILGLKKYFIFYLVTLLAGAFMIKKVTE